jgi:hypothetical protein
MSPRSNTKKTLDFPQINLGKNPPLQENRGKQVIFAPRANRLPPKGKKDSDASPKLAELNENVSRLIRRSPRHQINFTEANRRFTLL